jgi:hypothetical protein
MSWSDGIDVRLYGEPVLCDEASDCIGVTEARLASLHEATLALDYGRADGGYRDRDAFERAQDGISLRLTIPHETHRISERVAARELVGTHLREIGSATILLSSKHETLDDHWFADEMRGPPGLAPRPAPHPPGGGVRGQFHCRAA